MHTRQVPRTEWFRFFRDFSVRHEDWPINVCVVHPKLGAQVEASDLPLEGIVADRAGNGPISLHVGREPGDHVEHQVRDPVQVWVEVAETGVEEAVDIESADGTKTIIQFLERALPATSDTFVQPD